MYYHAVTTACVMDAYGSKWFNSRLEGIEWLPYHPSVFPARALRQIPSNVAALMQCSCG